MKFHFCFFIAILFVFHSSFAQIKDTLNDFPCYIVTNSSMQVALDSAISTANACPYFKSLNKKFYIIVDLDTNMCSFRIYPHNVTTICLYKYNWREFHKREGLCFYKGCYLYLLEHNSNFMMNVFFKYTGSSIDMILDKSDNIVEQSDPFLYFFRMDFSIKNKSLVRKWRDETDDYNWRMHHTFEYLVQNGDTWHTIAAKCGCSVEDLKKEFFEYEKPIPGLLLIVKYVFDENDCFQGIRRLD